MASPTWLRLQITGDVPIDLMAEYYGRRTSEGGPLISERAPVSIVVSAFWHTYYPL